MRSVLVTCNNFHIKNLTSKWGQYWWDARVVLLTIWPRNEVSTGDMQELPYWQCDLEMRSTSANNMICAIRLPMFESILPIFAYGNPLKRRKAVKWQTFDLKTEGQTDEGDKLLMTCQHHNFITILYALWRLFSVIHNRFLKAISECK